MPASLYMPEISVEVALTSGFLTPAASRVWTDISPTVEAQDIITITRGRQDQFASVQPSSLSLSLDNRDGRYTPENAAGAYYPNFKKGRPIRVRARFPLATPGNFFTANQSSHETDTTPWQLFGGATQAQSAVRAFDGTKSMLVTWPTGGLPLVFTTVSGLVIGRQYTLSAYVWVPVGSPAVRVGLLEITNGSPSTTTGAWERISYTFTATAGTHSPLVVPNGATTAGQQVWVDAWQLDEGGTVVTYTQAAPPIIDRFTGYLDTLPIAWPDGTSAFNKARVTATSRGARLGRQTELRSIVEEELLYDVPVVCYPLSESAGVPSLANIAPGRTEPLVPAQSGAGGGLVLGTGAGPTTDDLGCPTFAPASTSNGLYLRADLVSPVTVAGDHAIAIECWFTYTGAGNRTTLVTLAVDPALQNLQPAWIPSLNLEVNSSNQASVECRDGLSVLSSRTGPTVNDGLLHHAVAILELTDPTTVKVRLIVDGVDQGYGGSGTWPWSSGGVAFLPTYRYLFAGGVPINLSTGSITLLAGTLAHVALFRQAAPFTLTRFTEHYNAGLNGFTADGSGARVARYARLGGIPTAEVNVVETGLTTSIAHIPTTGQTPQQLMDQVVLTEDGLLFDGADGRLTFHARSHRYASTPAFTLDRNLDQVEGSLQPVLDDQQMTNDMTASRKGGVSARATNPASITDYGSYKASVQLVTTSDNEVQSRADWQVQRYGTPRVKIPSVRVDLLNTQSLAQAILAADLGTRFTIANLPSQAPASSLDFFVEGITESIGAESYFVDFNVSAAAYANVWQLDSATKSQLDSSTVLAY